MDYGKILKGDLPGHPFRGNQHTSGEGGESGMPGMGKVKGGLDKAGYAPTKEAWMEKGGLSDGKEVTAALQDASKALAKAGYKQTDADGPEKDGFPPESVYFTKGNNEVVASWDNDGDGKYVIRIEPLSD